jgi:hypothetical protein
VDAPPDAGVSLRMTPTAARAYRYGVEAGMVAWSPFHTRKKVVTTRWAA